MKKKGGVFFITLFFYVHLFFAGFYKNQFNLPVNLFSSFPFASSQLFLPMVTNERLVGYFVSPDGSDNNPGTLLLPWRTIGKAAQIIDAGDTVYIREGIYIEAVSFLNSGTELRPIRIMGYPGENPIVDGEHVIPGYGGGLFVIRGDYIYMSDIEVRNSGYMGVYVLGNYDVVDNLSVHHCKGGGIMIGYGHDSIVENSRVWRNSLTNEFGDADNWSAALAAQHGASYATLRHNEVWENWGEGIVSSGANQIVIENNYAHDNYSVNIYISDSTNILCQRNFVYTDPTSHVFPYGRHTGIAMGDERYIPPSANINIVNNISYGNYVNYWWWQGVQGGGMNNVLIANNTFVNSIGRNGVIISDGPHQDVRFLNNIVQQDDELDEYDWPVIGTFYNPEVTFSHNIWSKEPLDAASGPGDIVADPELARTGDPFAPAWFNLTASSPGIDNALLLPEVLVDFYSRARGSAPDRGAVEYFP
jgi:hypothetical protein